MFTRYVLPVLAVLGVVLGVVMVILSRQVPPTPPIEFPPPTSPYTHTVAGAGLVEASTEDIDIGAPFGEIVERVYVSAGDEVEKGAPLFKLDTETLIAERAETLGAYSVALANYEREVALPRPEDVPPAYDIYEAKKAAYKDHFEQFQLFKEIANPKAISQDEFNQRKYQAIAAEWEMQEAKDRLELLKAGAWIRDLEIARARVKEAKGRLDVIDSKIERSTVRAPINGTVLRVNVRLGEYAPIGELNIPLMIFGPIDPLHIRVDIDQNDAWRVIKGAPGVAFVRGNSTISAPLTYVRLEPYLVPKMSLTGENQEQVDTRVLQVIYKFPRNGYPIYPGQVMDVYLEAKPNLGEEEE